MSEENVTGPEGFAMPLVKDLLENTKPQKLTDADRLTLDLAKSQRQLALADAKTALANNEKAEIQYKYIVLQLYMKYGLSEKDALNEAGDILYNGAQAVTNG